jgi:hypothetical protein
LRFGGNLLCLPITSNYFLISLLFITFIISRYSTPSGLGALALGFGSNLLRLPITSDYSLIFLTFLIFLLSRYSISLQASNTFTSP